MGYENLARGMSEEKVKKKLERLTPRDRSKEFKGATPPSVFVGSQGYPNVNAGILSPQRSGSTHLMDSPRKWCKEDYSIEKVASLRSSLVNSRKRVKVEEANCLRETKEVAMAKKPVDIEVSLQKEPGKNISAGRIKPVSASGEIKNLNLTENPSVNRKIESKYYDKDVKTEVAIKELYKSGVSNYSIQKSFSTGLMGKKDDRKLVPTRWSITATDDLIAKNIRQEVNYNQELGEIRYHNSHYAGNVFHIFIMPGNWEYELIELKRPGSVWNANENTYIAQNYESSIGRKDYAEETAGAYYAARLPVLEHLRDINSKGKVLIIREVKPDYWAPLGVWVVRESVKKGFDSHKKIESFKNIREIISSNFKFQYEKIENNSKILNSTQRKISDYNLS